MRRRCGSSLNQLARDRHLHRSSVCKVLGRENQRAVKPPWPTEEFMLCYRKNFSANGTGVLPSSNFCHQILPMEDLSELFPLLLVSRQGDRLESDLSAEWQDPSPALAAVTARHRGGTPPPPQLADSVPLARYQLLRSFSPRTRSRYRVAGAGKVTISLPRKGDSGDRSRRSRTVCPLRTQ